MPEKTPTVELDVSAAKVGEPFVVPAGTEVRSLHPRDPAVILTRRKQTVTPHFVDRYPWGQTVITWAGTGGYWKRIEHGPTGEEADL